MVFPGMENWLFTIWITWLKREMVMVGLIKIISSLDGVGRRLACFAPSLFSAGSAEGC
jgi:hypothetical protein